MLVLLIKSSACLAIFMLFYKLCLEETSAHTFKRFYLIGAIIISIGIPFITFTSYIDVESVNVISTSQTIENPSTEFSKVKEIRNYIPFILWSIYAIGVILFSFRFFKNLFQLLQKTKNNPKHKNQNFINVLIPDLITPHTFFNYIFLNKLKFETHQIPKEVLLHEETHATQKHSLDVLFIELLQIIFWSNPMIYFIKHSIKLNHEFLADQAVIKHGVTPSTYQQIILAFSSNALEPQLANAFNYSSIKKRFTVMKTQTSKTTLWVRSLTIMPLLAILIYGFSSRDIIEKQLKNSQTSTLEAEYLKKDKQTSKQLLIIKVIDHNTIYINNKKCPLIDVEKEILNLVDNLIIKEKEGLSPLIVYNTPAPDETLKTLKNILRKHHILRINLKTETKTSKVADTIYFFNQKKQH